MRIFSRTPPSGHRICQAIASKTPMPLFQNSQQKRTMLLHAGNLVVTEARNVRDTAYTNSHLPFDNMSLEPHPELDSIRSRDSTSLWSTYLSFASLSSTSFQNPLERWLAETPQEGPWRFRLVLQKRAGSTEDNQGTQRSLRSRSKVPTTYPGSVVRSKSPQPGDGG